MRTVFRKDERGIRLFDIDDPAVPFYPEGFSVGNGYRYGGSYAIYAQSHSAPGIPFI